MNATEEEARRGFAKVMSGLANFWGTLTKPSQSVQQGPSINSFHDEIKKAWQGARLHKERVCIPHPINQEGV